MKRCSHIYEKLSDKPLYDYFDYSGFHVGVFICKCKKCGKKKERKFLADKQVGELFLKNNKDN